MRGRRARRGCGQGSGGRQHTTAGYNQIDKSLTGKHPTMLGLMAKLEKLVAGQG
jgi:hypothetical protein